MLLAEISMWPMDKGVSVSEPVSKVLAVIDESGLPYKLGPLGTCVEGEVGDVMRLVERCHAVLEEDSDRIACSIKMDWRRGRTGGLDSKVQSVQTKAGRELRT